MKSLQSSITQSFAVIPKGEYDIGGQFGIGRKCTVITPGFAIATKEVTNAQFAKFVEATGYITDAERNLWSWVSVPEVIYGQLEFRWQRIRYANWRQPLGPKGPTAKDHENAAVVQVSPRDARAFAKWMGARLPQGHEWEIANRFNYESVNHYSRSINKVALPRIGMNREMPHGIPDDFVFSFQRYPLYSSIQSFMPVAGLECSVSEICANIGLQQLKTGVGRKFSLIRGSSWFEDFQGHKYYVQYFLNPHLSEQVSHLNFVDYMPFYQGKANVGFRVAMDLEQFKRLKSKVESD